MQERLERFVGRKHGFFWLYTIVFAVLFFVSCLPLWVNGKGLIREVDGLSMLYTNFVWIGRWIREFFANVFINHTFVVPMWTTDLGYGSDILTVIGPGIVNPFYWVSAVVPERYAEFAFQFVIVLRLWLAGLAFVTYARYHGNGKFVTFLGALAYVFAGSTVIIFSQPGFIETMILFPLFLLSADRVFDGKSPLFFIGMCVLLFASSYYTGYMMCLFLLGYCLLRYFVVEGRRSAKDLAKLFFKFAGYLCVGIVAAAIFFLPVLMSMTGMERLSLERYIPAFYELRYYVGLLTGFMTYYNTFADSFIGFNAFMPLLLYVLFIRRKENKGLFIAFIAMTVIFLFPQLGSMMNGFQYPTNRWSWAYDFCGAYVLVKMLPQIGTLSSKQKKVLVGLVAAYGILIVLLANPLVGGPFYILYAIMVAALACVFSANRFTARQFQLVSVVVIVLSGFFNYYYYLSPRAGGHAYNQVGLTRSYEMQTEWNSTKVLSGVSDESEWRYDRAGTFSIFNNSLFIGRQGTDFYINMYNSNVDAFHKSLGLPWGIAFQYAGEDSRSALDAVLGVKYFIDPVGDDVHLPYMFRNGEVLAVDEEVDAELHEASDYLPLAFAYDKTVSRENFETLDPVQKQEVLMQAGVVELDEDATESSLPDTTSFDIDYDVVLNEGDSAIEVVEDGWIVNKAGASLELEFNAPRGCELYLEAKGLNFEGFNPRETYSDEEWSSIGQIGRNTVAYNTAMATDVREYSMSVQTDEVSKNIGGYTYKSHMYGGTTGWVLNMGYSDEERTSMKISFGNAGKYSFEDIRVIVQPMDSFDGQLQNLSKVIPSDFSYEGNVIEGSIDMPDSRYLYISVPYSSGWSATLDGEPVEIKRMNIGFMGLDVPAGQHEFKITYSTPYIMEGAVVSCVGLMAIAVITVYWGRKKKRQGGVRGR